MKYPTDIDIQCIPLCDAMNSIAGIQTISSCCGHGKAPFGIYFQISADGLNNLPSFLYWFDGCHSFIERDWIISVSTDCSKARAMFSVHSYCSGKKAYAEANEIAKRIMEEAKK